jgi:gamma-glutamyl-gamma-aminobutyrate hydrolase PuuD
MNDFPSTQYTYLPASYVKQLEASGTIVISLSWEASYKELNHTLHTLDGLLFTGGNTILSLNDT